MTAVKWVLCLSLIFAQTGCIKSMAINSLADALGDGGGSFAQDDDPEFVGQASAFGLKTIESLIDASPNHPKLLVAATRGFTQYAYAYLQTEADYTEENDYESAKKLRYRAWRMYRRARGYGVRAIENVIETDFSALGENEGLMARFQGEHVDLLYWTAAASAAAVAVNKDDAELAADLDLVEKLVQRAIQLQPHYQTGALYDFMISWDGGRPAAAGGSLERATDFYNKALKLSAGRRLAPSLAYAESVLIKQQDKVKFLELLKTILVFDVDQHPEFRLANLIAQRRAQWLLTQVDDLFL
ncbi:MAG: hypothetical protein CMH52_04540 [Myxococcales bacterium]|nr:hypothetical protein [Myxococcales bacterium]